MGSAPPEGVTPGLPPKEVDQGCNPPQGQVDCKVEAHVWTQHTFFLLSSIEVGPVHAGPVAFGNLGFAPARPDAHL